jgi:hypothetical protein
MAITVETALDRRMITAIIASSIGFSLDLFDLFILLYVAPAVGKAFFPSDIPTLSLAAVYASFPVTLMMRPIGSALFGNYADRHVRKGAMMIAVIGVGSLPRRLVFCPPSPRLALSGLSFSSSCAWSRACWRRRRGLNPHDRHRIRSATLERAVVWLHRRRWRWDRRPTRVYRLLHHFVDLHRGFVRHLGLAFHVFRRRPEFRIWSVHLRCA